MKYLSFTTTPLLIMGIILSIINPGNLISYILFLVVAGLYWILSDRDKETIKQLATMNAIWNNYPMSDFLLQLSDVIVNINRADPKSIRKAELFGCYFTCLLKYRGIEKGSEKYIEISKFLDRLCVIKKDMIVDNLETEMKEIRRYLGE